MIERLALILILMAAGVLVYRLTVRRQMRQARAAAGIDPLLADIQPGTPTLVYFTTPDCALCRLQQTPTLERLQREAGVRVIRVDAAQEIETANRWGVFSVPTTFVLDGSGQPRVVYNGVVDAATLKQASQV